MSVSTQSRIGLLRRAVVDSVNLEKAELKVVFAEPGSTNNPQLIPVRYPGTIAGPSGKFSGGFFERGDNVIIGQGPGTEWFFVSSILPNLASDYLTSPLRKGRILFQTGQSKDTNASRLFLDPKSGVEFGDPINFIHAEPSNNIPLFSNTFKHQLSFSEAHRSVSGIVRRDLVPNSNRGVTGSTLFSHPYEASLKTVPMDLSSIESTGGVFVRNLPLVENRQVIYEFANSFIYTNDTEESVRTGDNTRFENSKAHKSRRNSRADVLSLSLVSPNQLLETIKGTVVDVFGNILDINRSVLPIGKTDELSLSVASDRSDAFARIRRELRKSIVYHFEVNARKDTVKDLSNPEVLPPSDAPDVSSIDDYARDRSRFSFDIDKEGQIKANVPASSETGNVPLLTRYENVSTLRAAKNGTNPDVFECNTEGFDVSIESFATISPVALSAGDTTLEGFASPLDRVTQEPMRLGTAYHDVAKALSFFQIENPVSYKPDNLINDTNVVPIIGDGLDFNDPNKELSVVNHNIIVSGTDANAGGRSGTINFDGSLSLNVGANTVDRQSLWFDYAGGIIGRVGRDLQGISYGVSLDGDLLLQVGGTTVSNDSRFSGPNGPNNAFRSGAVDIRVVSSPGGTEEFAEVTVVRIDTTGVSIVTPGRLDIESEGNIKISAGAHLILNGDRIFFYGDQEIEDTAGTSNAREVMRTNLSL